MCFYFSYWNPTAAFRRKNYPTISVAAEACDHDLLPAFHFKPEALVLGLAVANCTQAGFQAS